MYDRYVTICNLKRGVYGNNVKKDSLVNNKRSPRR